MLSVSPTFSLKRFHIWLPLSKSLFDICPVPTLADRDMEGKNPHVRFFFQLRRLDAQLSPTDLRHDFQSRFIHFVLGGKAFSTFSSLTPGTAGFISSIISNSSSCLSCSL